MEVVGYICLFFVGLILGMVGGGGAILSVPIMVYLFSMDIILASAYSLFIVGTSSLAGAILKFRSGLISVKTIFAFGLPSILTIFITRRWLVDAIPDILFQSDTFMLTKRLLILVIFSMMMVAASVSMIRRKKSNSTENYYLGEKSLGVSGILVGFLTGLVGAGGGFLILPVLVRHLRLPFNTAVGTTLLIITFNSYIGFLGDIFNHAIDWRFLLNISLLSIAGMFAGIKASNFLPAQNLQKLFGWFVLVMGSCILIRELGFLNVV